MGDRLVVTFCALLCACADEGGLTRVAADGFFDPPSVTLFDTRVGDVSRQEVAFRNASPGSLEVVSLAFEPRLDVFEVRATDGRSIEGRRLAPTAGVDLEILFGPDREATYASTLVLRSRDLEIGLSVSGFGSTLAPARLAGPMRVAFTDPLVVGQIAFQPIEVQNLGEQNARLQRGRSDGPFGVTLAGGDPLEDAGPIAPGERRALEVRFAPDEARMFEDTLTLEAERGVPWTIEVSGAAEPAGTMACTPTAVDFGTVVRGDRRFIVVNCAAQDGSIPIAEVAWTEPPDAPLVLRNVSPPPPRIVRDVLTFEIGLVPDGLPEQHEGTVQVRRATGEVQSIEVRGQTAAPNPEDVDLSITASWEVDADIDLHLVQAGAQPYAAGQDCHWGNKTLDWNLPDDLSDDPFLDRDARNGPGEETINLEDPGAGIYEVWVQYFGPPNGEATDVVVDLRMEGAPPTQRVRTLTVCGGAWHVGRVRFDVTPPVFEPIDVETNAFASFTFDCAG